MATISEIESQALSVRDAVISQASIIANENTEVRNLIAAKDARIAELEAQINSLQAALDTTSRYLVQAQESVNINNSSIAAIA